MNDTATRTIRATIDPSAVERVNAFFDASAEQAIAEVYQNARRSGASRIRVMTVGSPDDTIVVQDDGRGIDTPESVLAFGRSDWTGPAEDEHPAGMGLYALARYGGEIRSSTGRVAWEAELRPEHFTGKNSAEVRGLDASTTRRGTTVRIRIPGSNEHELVSAAMARAYYLPVPVTVNGQTVRKYDFLGDAFATIQDSELRIGVTGAHVGGSQMPSLNFHGLPVQVRMPSVRTCNGSLTARVDVRHCPGLELVLPARDRAVETPFLETLRHRIRKGIYKLIAEMKIDVPHVVQTEAAKEGVTIPDAAPRLRRACYTNANNVRTLRERERVEPEAAIVIPDHWPVSDVNALNRAISAANAGIELWYAETQLQGYPWYDRLRHATRLVTRYKDEKRWHRISAQHPKNLPGAISDAIELALEVREPDGSVSTLKLPTDIALGRNTHEGGYGRFVGLVLTQQPGVNPDAVAAFATDSLLITSDAPDATTPEEQNEEFYGQVLENATELLVSKAAAERNAIARSIEHRVVRHCPSTGTVRIRIRDRNPEIVSIEDRAAAVPASANG